MLGILTAKVLNMACMNNLFLTIGASHPILTGTGYRHIRDSLHLSQGKTNLSLAFATQITPRLGHVILVVKT